MNTFLAILALASSALGQSLPYTPEQGALLIAQMNGYEAGYAAGLLGQPAAAGQVTKDVVVRPGSDESCFRNYDLFPAYCRELDIALRIVTGEEYKRLERLYYNILEYGCYEGWLLKDKACYAYTSPQDVAPYPEAVMASATCVESLVRVGYKFCTAPAVVK